MFRVRHPSQSSSFPLNVKDKNRLLEEIYYPYVKVKLNMKVIKL